MIKVLQIIFVAILTSCFFFPFVPTFLPVGNTKMVLAAMGLITLFLNKSRGKKGVINADMMNLTGLALVISLISLVSVVLNETRDYTFVSYFISMWVWMGAAYFVIQMMKWVHGHLSVELVGKYLIAISVAQCLLAFTMDLYSPLKQFIDSILSGEGFMGKNKDRLYGLGCALDVAGIKFSAVLIVIAHLVGYSKCTKCNDLKWYIFALMIIGVIGNMISRTTVIGLSFAFIYLFYIMLKGNDDSKANARWFFRFLMIAMLGFIPFVIFLYNTNTSIQENLRFAFEGFFSLFETGEWQTHSNDILKKMVVYPDNMYTWIIGDGYFNGPSIKGSPDYDPYYLGPNYGEFYKGTDIGYLRYIFYFGVTGLMAFIIYFCKAAHICIKSYRSCSLMFLLILLMNFIGWFKVSSDIFPVFAIFLVLAMVDENKEVIEDVIPEEQ